MAPVHRITRIYTDYLTTKEFSNQTSELRDQKRKQEPVVEDEVKEDPEPVNAFRSDPLPAKPIEPQIEKAGVEPIEPAAREHVETLDVKLDLSDKVDEAEGKDGRIRKLGWGEYGKKLFARNRKRDGRKKKE